MFVLISLFLAIVGLVKASQLVLSSQPLTGNVAYTLLTERTFLLNIPEDYVHGEPYPLVLSFHGGEQSFLFNITDHHSLVPFPLESL
jgi:poly(3-hydroxybutyrate) depolymerase